MRPLRTGRCTPEVGVLPGFGRQLRGNRQRERSSLLHNSPAGASHQETPQPMTTERRSARAAVQKVTSLKDLSDSEEEE